MDHIRIDAMQQVNQTPEAKQVQNSDEAFKFTLMSKIEEDGLAERLEGMMKEITQQGKKLGKKMDIRDMKHYRALIKDEKDAIAILDKVDEIRGLLLDIVT